MAHMAVTANTMINSVWYVYTMRYGTAMTMSGLELYKIMGIYLASIILRGNSESKEYKNIWFHFRNIQNWGKLMYAIRRIELFLGRWVIEINDKRGLRGIEYIPFLDLSTFWYIHKKYVLFLFLYTICNDFL